MPPKALILFRSFTRASLLLALSLSLLRPLQATPSDELTLAVMAGGSSDVGQATGDQFLRAFNATIVRVKERVLPSYVTSAVKLRPDLADQIVVAALHLRRVGKNQIERRLSCDAITRIIRAAVAAAPEASAAIVRAAVNAEPYARDCIVAAAVSAAPEQEWAIRQAVGEGQTLVLTRMGSPINPADFVSQQGAQVVNSPEQPPSAP